MDVRRTATLAFAAVAVASAAIGTPATVRALDREHAVYAPMSAAEADRYAGTYHRLPPDVFDFYRARVREGDRYYVHAAAGRPVGLVDEAAVVRTYSAYWLLPALQVHEARLATVVIAFRADPRELPLTYTRVERFRSGADSYAVARVRR